VGCHAKHRTCGEAFPSRSSPHPTRGITMIAPTRRRRLLGSPGGRNRGRSIRFTPRVREGRDFLHLRVIMTIFGVECERFFRSCLDPWSPRPGRYESGIVWEIGAELGSGEAVISGFDRETRLTTHREVSRPPHAENVEFGDIFRRRADDDPGTKCLGSSGSRMKIGSDPAARRVPRAGHRRPERSKPRRAKPNPAHGSNLDNPHPRVPEGVLGFRCVAPSEPSSVGASLPMAGVLARRSS
jgi:hypothetical protein